MQTREAVLAMLENFDAEIPVSDDQRGIPLKASGRRWVIDMSIADLVEHVETMNEAGIAALGEPTENFHPGAALVAVHLEETIFSAGADESQALHLRAHSSGFYRIEN